MSNAINESNSFFAKCPKCNNLIFVKEPESKAKCYKCSSSHHPKDLIIIENNEQLLQNRNANIAEVLEIKKQFDKKSVNKNSYCTFCHICGSEVSFDYDEWNIQCKTCGAYLNRNLSPPYNKNDINSERGNPILELIGINGNLLLFPNKIIISRSHGGIMTGLSQGFSKGDKNIYISQISSIQIKKPGITNGYIQFSISGGKESTGGVFSATTDENTVMFTSEMFDTAQQIRDTIDKIKDGNYHSPEKRETIFLNVPEEIRKYKGLLDDGIITQEEFESKKRQLLKL